MMKAGTTPRRRRLRSFSLLAIGAAALLFIIGVVVYQTLAASSVPTVSSFLANDQSLSWVGGPTTFSAEVSNASRCILSAKPPIKGLSAKLDCQSGRVRVKVTLPKNTGPAIKYSFGLSIIGTTTIRAKPISLTIGAAPLLTGVRSLVSDGSGQCAVFRSGRVDCWGVNLYGEIGNGTFGGPVGGYGAGTDGSFDTPQAVSGISNAVSLASDGDRSNCALLSTGRVDCWGWVGVGQLGNGSIPRGWQGYTTPQPVIGIDDAISLNGSGSGEGGYCAVLSTGSVECWGDNDGGQLGNGTTGGPTGEGGYDTPQQVIGITDAVAVASAESEQGGSCALLSTGEVKCWGDNVSGELGNGTVGGPDGRFASSYDTPQTVIGINNAISITGSAISLSGVFEGVQGGPSSYCAVLSTGKVACWGDNNEGELGNGTTAGKSGSCCGGVPQNVAGVTDAVSVSGSSGHYCAVFATGGVDCWGDNEGGELGNGTTGGPDCVTGTTGHCDDTPQAVVGIRNAVSLSIGGGNNCALLSTHSVECWGYNGYGEVGKGNSSRAGQCDCVDTAQPINGIRDAVSVAIGPCAVLSNGRVDCWGDNLEGGLGIGTTGGPDNGGYDTPQAVRY
jgi:alpha-tubulin suppressor-like RCC1 family protein